MSKYLLTLTLLLLNSATFAETAAEPTPSSTAKEYRFTIKGSSKKSPATAVLKLTEKKDLVYLYFEGSELPSGKYKVLKGKSCSAINKEIRSKKPLDEANELYSFETKYGNISGEKNLSFKNFQELGIESIAIALIKEERKSNTVISCLN